MNCFRRLVYYVLEQEKADSFLLTRNFRGLDKSPESIIEQYVSNERKRKISKVNTVKAHHEVLSFSEEDSSSITEEDIQKVARTYMKKRAGRSLAVCAYHPTPHPHLHFIFSGATIDHTSARISKAEFEQIKKDMESFQDRELNLTHSSVQHGIPTANKMKALENEYRLKQRTRKPTKKELTHFRIQEIYEASSSPKDFLKRLAKSDIEVYERNGQLVGVRINGRKIRLSRLGFSKEKILNLDRAYQIMKQLADVRNKKKQRKRGRER